MKFELSTYIKQQLRDTNAFGALDYIEKLEEKIKEFENGDVCWRGDMDATIKQNLDLKKENEELRNDIEIANSQRQLAEKEKCELLGIIQEKDELIKQMKEYCKVVF